MGRKFDIERLLDTVVDILQDDLPTKITALNAEFASDGFGITLAAPANTSYFFGGLPDEVNVDPWIVVDVFGSTPSSANGSAVSKQITVYVAFGGAGFIMDTQEKIKRSFLRYMRALEECIAAKFDVINSSTSLLIEQIPSIEMEDAEGEVIRTDPGILIKANFI